MSSTSKAMQRILSLLDENSFVEIGAKVTARATGFNMRPDQTPSDGVITGYGLIDGSLVYVYSQNAEVLGGSVGEMHARKIADLYRLAVRTGAPVIGLVDSTGLRLQEATDALHAFASVYAAQAGASGVIPQITAVFGSCGGGLALIPAITDFSYMAEDASLFVNAPNALAGNAEDRNNTASAAAKAAAGLVDGTGSEEEVIAMIRDLVEMLPSNYEDEASGECTDELNRECPDLAASAGDPALVLSMIADNGIFAETKADYAREMVTAFARIGGITAGIVANRTALYDEEGKEAESFEPALTTGGCYKAADFVRFCDAFSIPVISLTNARGFAATEGEEKKIADAAGKLAYAFACATTAKINVVTGSAFGSAYAVMNAKGLGCDLTFAFPDARIGMMDAGMAAKILAAGESAEEIARTARDYDALQNSIDSAAARGYVDQIVEPASLRRYLIGALEILYTKREDRPSRKHGTR